MNLDNVHSDLYTITSYHSDFKQDMSTVALFCFLQESAWRHAQSKGFGWEHLAEKNRFWILAKVEARLYRIPKWTEKIRLETWGKEPEFLTAYRDFKLYDNQNQHIISATSSWHILDMNTKKPMRITEFKDKFPIIADYHAIEEKPEKIQIPALDTIKIETAPFLIANSDIDMNQHVNNTKYVQWAIDTLPFQYHEAHSLERICVNFVAEACSDDDECFVRLTEINPNEFTCVILRRKDCKVFATVKMKWKPNHCS